MNNIITDVEKLKNVSEPLEFITDTGRDETEGREITEKIKEVMNSDENILALSAPQIGINKRIFCIRFSDQIKTFINPILKKKGEQIVSFETCVSFPNKEIAICRPSEIEVAYYTDEFKYEDNKFIGSAAKIFDQQYQLLDGIVPGEALKVFEEGREIEVDDIPSIVSAEYSGCGIIANIESEEDHFTTDDLNDVSNILGKLCDRFIEIGSGLKQSDKTEIRVAYNQLEFQEQIITGKISVMADDPLKKLNREQRRAIKFKKRSIIR